MAAPQRSTRSTPRRTPAAPAAPAKESVRVRVHALLRSRITSLELLPGTPLSENELATELDVSRTPVREALILLGEESLVDVFPKLGTFVSRISVDAVLEAQFMREALELAALREAVERADAEDIAALRAILDAQRAALTTADPDAFFEQDEAFHRRLMEASGYRTLWRTVTTAKAHLDRARRLSLPSPTASRTSSPNTQRWLTHWSSATPGAPRRRCADISRGSSRTPGRSRRTARNSSPSRTAERHPPAPVSIPDCGPDDRPPAGGDTAGLTSAGHPDPSVRRQVGGDRPQGGVELLARPVGAQGPGPAAELSPPVA